MSGLPGGTLERGPLPLPTPRPGKLGQPSRRVTWQEDGKCLPQHAARGAPACRPGDRPRGIPACGILAQHLESLRDSQSRGGPSTPHSPRQSYWIQAVAPYLSPSEPKALSPAFRSRPPGRTRLQSGSWQPHELLGWPAWLTQEATLNALIRLPWDWFNKMSAEMGHASGGSRQTQRWQRCLRDDHIHVHTPTGPSTGEGVGWMHDRQGAGLPPSAPTPVLLQSM